ncbi:TetR/AcrR family transcriptional regulator [Thalassotalea marina]|uniref:TetR family transcriptional regulator n=1 Tax=Thalassotalea marina TaxID=1673741 RepID=A0A919BMA6_9GAMM|nr:TetR/AcrR family transcriptional regulator [Thalassotalea marina]GHG01263.1 TetR family transcriptional regulator [Thalassotalea marina]
MTDYQISAAKQDWLDFALAVLKKHGPERLKIQPLCDAKGVSKGSFYHHFASRADFIEQLMEYWYQSMTVSFIEQANTKGSPLERLEKLDQVIASNKTGTELHIRAWALKTPSIRPHLEKIDKQRQAYLAECYVGLGLAPQLAEDYALMAYANFLGMQQIYPTPSIEEVLRVTTLGMKSLLKLER